MKKLCMAALIASIPLGSSAYAADLPEFPDPMNPINPTYGWYAEATAGVGFGEVTLDGPYGLSVSDDEIGFTGRLGFGKVLGDNSRIGVEGLFSAYSETTEGIDLDVNAWAVMAVAYYDFRNETRFTPYIGVGAGLGFMDFDVSVDLPSDLVFAGSETTTHVALKLAAGVAFDVTENMQFVADYNFVYLHDAEYNYLMDASATQNTITLGLRYAF